MLVGKYHSIMGKKWAFTYPSWQLIPTPTVCLWSLSEPLLSQGKLKRIAFGSWKPMSHETLRAHLGQVRNLEPHVGTQLTWKCSEDSQAKSEKSLLAERHL